MKKLLVLVSTGIIYLSLAGFSQVVAYCEGWACDGGGNSCMKGGSEVWWFCPDGCDGRSEEDRRGAGRVGTACGSCSASCGPGTRTCYSYDVCGATWGHYGAACNNGACCSGVSGNCGAWSSNCGTQSRTCYDTGCGSVRPETRAGPSCCSGVYAGCTAWTPACGAQTRTCYDTGCGTARVENQTAVACCVSTGCPAEACGSLACGTCNVTDNCGATLTCNSSGGAGCGTVDTSGGPGVLEYGATFNKGEMPGEISSTKWRAKTVNNIYSNYKVAGYWDVIINAKSPQNIGNGVDINSKMTGGITNYFKSANNLTLNREQKFDKSGAAIVLVNGDLTIDSPIKRTGKKAFPAFFVTGKIIFGTSLAGTAAAPDIDGVFYADGKIEVPATNKQFNANGIFIALDGFNLLRSLGNDETTGNPKIPPEKFSFDPSLVINAPVDLMKSNYSWKEVAP